MPPKSQRFKSQRLQDANATKSQTLAFYKLQRFSATTPEGPAVLKHTTRSELSTRSVSLIVTTPVRIPFLERERTWAIAARRGSYYSLFLLNSGRFSPRKIGRFSSELRFA